LRGRLQGDLFPFLTVTAGPLTGKMQQFVTVLEMAPVGAFLTTWPGLPGRPPADRAPLARAFIAKAVLGIAMTSLLIERLRNDKTLRLLCGWPRHGAVPSESTFSRAFAEFAASALPARVHEALIKSAFADRIVGHVSRDATAIEAREKPVKVEAPKRWRRKRRPEKGEPGHETVRRLERQPSMTLVEMLQDLPVHCAVGMKPNAKGFKSAWTGYKLLTSASLHDSQAAIPLATMTAGRITHLYELMDASAMSKTCLRHGTRPRSSPPAGRSAGSRSFPRSQAAPRVSRTRWRPRLSRGPQYPLPDGRPRALPRAHGGRACQCETEGRVRRPAGARQGPCQGPMPPDVRPVGPHGRSTDAPARVSRNDDPNPVSRTRHLGAA
jgi:hypothetical protein